MSVSSTLKQFLIASFSAILMVCAAVSSEGWQELASFEEERQVVVFEYNPMDLEIRMKADKGGFFSKEHKKSYSVGTSESLNQALRDIAEFLEDEHFSAQLYPRIELRLSQFRNLTVAECQALHMPLSQPLSKNSLNGLLQEVQKLDRAMRAPAQSVQSIKITEIELDGEKVDLHLSLDSQGFPTGVGLVKKEGDFSALKMSSEGYRYSLFNAHDERVLDLVLHTQKQENLNSQKIEIELIRPASEKSLSETEKEMLILNAEGESWHFSIGGEGVNAQTFEQEIESIFHEYDIEADSFAEEELFKDWFTKCKVYESQLQISTIDHNYFCRELVPLQVFYLKGISKIEGDVAQKSFQERYRGCLQDRDLMKDKRAEFKLPTKPLPEMIEGAQKCQDRAYLPYEQDGVVSSILQEDVVKEHLSNEQLKVNLADVLHAKAFSVCEEKGLVLSSHECREKIENVKNEYLMETRIGILFQQISGSQANGPSKDEMIDSWEECLSQGEIKDCADHSFLEIGKVMASSVSFNLDDEAANFKISLNDFSEWRESFEAEMSACLEAEVGETESFNQLMSGYSFMFEDCREKAGLALYPKWYKEHLSKELSRFSGSRPVLWEELITEAVRDLQQKIDDGEFSYKSQLEERLPEILKEDTAEVLSSYLAELKSQSLLSQQQFEGLKRTYGLSAEQDMGWKATLLSLFENRNSDEIETLVNDFYLNVQKAELRSIADEAQLSDQDKEFILESVDECMNIPANQGHESLGEYSVNCRKDILAQEMILSAKKNFEEVVSHHFRLTGERANKILSPVWYMNRCKDDLPRGGLNQEDYLARVQVCIDLARMDVYELVMTELVDKNKSLMTRQSKGPAAENIQSCLQGVFKQMSEESDEPSLRALVSNRANQDKTRQLSLYEIQEERFQSSFRRPLLSRLFAEEHMGRSRSRQDAVQLRKYITVLQDYPEFRGEWIQQQLEACVDQTQDRINTALRESFLQHSEHYQNDQMNSQGETDVEVLKYVLDDELIGLVLEMRDQRGSAQVSSDFTFDALSRAQQVISQKLAQGFIFDRDALKTELIIFRDQLKEGLRWMNMRGQDVSINELALFFESSKLADMLAYAEVSSMVHERFSSFLLDMKDKELSEFEHQVGHRPNWRLSDEEKEAKRDIIKRYQRLGELAHEMTSSYDFRRIIHQNSSKGRELLSLLKQHFLLAQITGREVGPQAYERTWELMGELIIEDKTPGGFAERFVSEIAQSHLDQQKQEKWGITKALFYDDEDFEWDELRKTASGRRALNYYTRYLLFPKVMGRELSGYLEKLRRSEFERYLSRAQDEN